MFVKDSPEHEDAESFARKQMADKLNNNPELCEKLIPKWELGCRRITPGQGYLESFTRDNVQLTNSSITSIDATGIHTEEGKHYEVDVVICATGFDVSQVPNFKVAGRNGVTLAQKWAKEVNIKLHEFDLSS